MKRSLKEKLRAILKHDHSEQMFAVRRMPIGLERERRPALRSLADYMALRRKEAEMA